MTRDLSGKKEFEIGYSVLPEYWGKGFATELAKQLKKFGLQNKVSEKFISIIHKENLASMAVATKIGMAILSEKPFMKMKVLVFGERNNSNP